MLGTSGLSFLSWLSIACKGVNTEANSLESCELSAETAGFTHASGIAAQNEAIPELSTRQNAKIDPPIFFIFGPYLEDA